MNEAEQTKGIDFAMTLWRAQWIGRERVTQIANIVWKYADDSLGPDRMDHSLCEAERAGLLKASAYVVKQEMQRPELLPVFVWMWLIKFVIELLIDFWLTNHKVIVANCGDPD